MLAGHLKGFGYVDPSYGDIGAAFFFYAHPEVHALIVAKIAEFSHPGENYSVQTITFDP